MPPSLKISQKVIDRLLLSSTVEDRTDNKLIGKLYGILAKNNLIILGFELLLLDTINSNLLHSFPADVDHCGIIQLGDNDLKIKSTTSEENEEQIKERLRDIDVTDNPVFIKHNNNNVIAAWFCVNDRLEPTKYTAITEQDIYSQFIHLNLVAQLPVSCDITREQIIHTFTGLRKSIASGAMAFNFTKTRIYLLGSNNSHGGNEGGLVGIGDNLLTVGELVDDTWNDSSEGSARKKKHQFQRFELDVLKVDMLKRVTNESNSSKNHAPLYIFDKKQQSTMNFVAVIDSLAMVHRQVNISGLYEILVESAIRQLKLMEKSLLNRLNSTGKLSEPLTYHFYPPECAHFVTRCYLADDTDAFLLSERETLHKQLLLSLNRPLFRKANKYNFKDKMQKLLINPHESLKTTDNSNNGGEIALVKGNYAYYHYCQNRMDDNGWGCAYRSLQTLASWYQLQGYTDKAVPTFKEIQKCLVDIGDKPASFIGSKQWIGSTEVNFVLNTLLQVTSKILYVSSGDEMSSKGPELVNHFENHGSPVMIGGGVLAHTILGVDYNQLSGTLKFLILDPHYTGDEDLHTILNKGWCGWKGLDFWDKTCYYNMCLPQVPIGI